MSTDRELLTLAAKAYGFGSPISGAVTWTENHYPRGTKTKGALWNFEGWGETAELWNPLTDDGDAFRLAVVCKIDIKLYQDHVVAWYEDFFGTGKIPYDDDPRAATRRAIVMAAAEIAKGMMSPATS